MYPYLRMSLCVGVTWCRGCDYPTCHMGWVSVREGNSSLCGVSGSVGHGCVLAPAFEGEAGSLCPGHDHVMPHLFL